MEVCFLRGYLQIIPFSFDFLWSDRHCRNPSPIIFHNSWTIIRADPVPRPCWPSPWALMSWLPWDSWRPSWHNGCWNCTDMRSSVGKPGRQIWVEKTDDLLEKCWWKWWDFDVLDVFRDGFLLENISPGVGIDWTLNEHWMNMMVVGCWTLILGTLMNYITYHNMSNTFSHLSPSLNVFLGIGGLRSLGFSGWARPLGNMASIWWIRWSLGNTATAMILMCS